MITLHGNMYFVGIERGLRDGNRFSLVGTGLSSKVKFRIWGAFDVVGYASTVT